jgi:ABC-type nitrate/sulfonate/bicarbonate transport system substrate-binding protein
VRAAPPLLAFLALTAGGSLPSPSLAAAPVTVAIGTPRSVTCFPLHAARELGYFDEGGVSVTFVEPEESEVPDALRTGRVDLACGSAVLPLEALRQLIRAVLEAEAPSYRLAIHPEAIGHAVATLRALRGIRGIPTYGQIVSGPFTSLWNE